MACSAPASLARSSLAAVALCLLVSDGLIPARIAAEPPEPGVFGTRSVPPDILKLLEQTREAYGADAVALQALLLHHTIHSRSILSASVHVSKVLTNRGQRYLLFDIETGIVFNDHHIDRNGRIRRVWSEIVLPALTRSDSYEVPADGAAVALRYFHRPYKDTAELEDTVVTNPGTIERTTFYLLFRDLLAYRAQEIDATELYARAHRRTDHSPNSKRDADGP